MRLTNTAHRKMNSLLRLAACLCCLVMLLCITLPAGAARLERYLDPDKITSLTMTYRPNGVPLSGVEFRLYRIASVDGDSNFTLLAPFNRYSIQFRRDMSTDEWQGLAETLAGYVVADRIGEAYNRLTNDEGVIKFPALATGLYLVMGDSCDFSEEIYTPKPSLVVLPNRQSDGWWNYDVEINPKWEMKPIIREDLTVLKVWSDSNYASRPSSITVELFCDGESYVPPKNSGEKNPVTLNRSNNWRYTWKGLDTRNTWTVVERDVPAGYTVSVSREGTNFIVTNYRPTTPTPKPTGGSSTPSVKLPQTGLDWWPIPVLALCGMLLFALGWLKQRQDET